MHKHAETFHDNKGYKLAIIGFMPCLSFSKYEFVVHFLKVICTKTKALHTSLLFI